MSETKQLSLRARNLTARSVLGNPVTAQLDSGVGNCFPGLEIDTRNLDRRFFPGILFQFVVRPMYLEAGKRINQQGARVLYLDYLEDPMLDPKSDEPWVQALLMAYTRDLRSLFSEGLWYLDWVEQHGRRIVMHTDDLTPYDGLVVWRFIRCLEPDAPITIGIVRRDDDGSGKRGAVQLTGYRRRYVTEAGVIAPVFRPGELTESLCNPWQHDFRDCACHYWASNHPDVVLAKPEQVQGLGTTYLDWIREDRGPSGAVAAAATIEENRPFQIDHYQINEMWQELPFVLDDHEIDAPYVAPRSAPGEVFSNAGEMLTELRERLAPLELSFAFEYLFALFSLRSPEDADFPRDHPTLRDDVTFARHYLQIVVASEMTHLRWTNQLLWELDRAGFYPVGDSYSPVLLPAVEIPDLERGPRVVALRPLTLDTLDDYIALERKGGVLDCSYARCVATLRQPAYPKRLNDLAARIGTDGTNHFERFSDMRRLLSGYGREQPAYLRNGLRVGTPRETHTELALRDRIIELIRHAYVAEARGDALSAERDIHEARGVMSELMRAADRLASEQRIGVPFFDTWPAMS